MNWAIKLKHRLLHRITEEKEGKMIGLNLSNDVPKRITAAAAEMGLTRRKMKKLEDDLCNHKDIGSVMSVRAKDVLLRYWKPPI
jgi:hypothetical protein